MQKKSTQNLLRRNNPVEGRQKDSIVTEKFLVPENSPVACPFISPRTTYQLIIKLQKSIREIIVHILL